MGRFSRAAAGALGLLAVASWATAAQSGGFEQGGAHPPDQLVSIEPDDRFCQEDIAEPRTPAGAPRDPTRPGPRSSASGAGAGAAQGRGSPMPDQPRFGDGRLVPGPRRAGGGQPAPVGQPVPASKTLGHPASFADQDPPEARVASGKIRGRLLACSGSFAAARVSISGHPKSTVTSPAGAFELDLVPPGRLDLVIETHDEGRVTIPGVAVIAGKMTDLGDVQLSDVVADPANCGACSQACPPGASCVYGVCICPEGFVRCGGTCTALDELDHCRACRNRCEAWPGMVPVCGPWDCVFLCVDGTADCDGRRLTGCESRIDSDPNNCGGCGVVCDPGRSCANAECR